MKNFNTIPLFLLTLIVATNCAPKKADETEVDPVAKVQVFGTPANFTVAPKDSGALLSFVYNPAATGGYNIYFGTDATVAGLGSGFLPSPQHFNANSIILGSLTNGTTYYFAVTALKSDGTESQKTAVQTVAPVDTPPTQVAITVTAELEFCVDQLDKIKFVEGKMILSDHEGGSDWPGKNDDCDVHGVRLHLKRDDGGTISTATIPTNGDWSPESIGAEIILMIPHIVKTLPITISDLEPVENKCSSVSFSGNKVRVSAAQDNAGVPNTVVFDATDCRKGKAFNFIGGDAIKFKLHYTVNQ